MSYGKDKVLDMMAICFFANTMKNYMKGEYDFDGNEGVFRLA